MVDALGAGGGGGGRGPALLLRGRDRRPVPAHGGDAGRPGGGSRWGSAAAMTRPTSWRPPSSVDRAGGHGPPRVPGRHPGADRRREGRDRQAGGAAGRRPPGARGRRRDRRRGAARRRAPAGRRPRLGGGVGPRPAAADLAGTGLRPPRPGAARRAPGRQRGPRLRRRPGAGRRADHRRRPGRRRGRRVLARADATAGGRSARRHGRRARDADLWLDGGHNPHAAAAVADFARSLQARDGRPRDADRGAARDQGREGGCSRRCVARRTR